MPELPEVETVRRGLQRRVTGRRVAAVEVRGNGPLVITGSPDEFAAAVIGRAIAGFERKGKALAIELRSPNGHAPAYLLVRLGMTGQLTVQPADAPLEPHTHVRMSLEGGAEEIRYSDARRFGRLRACTRQELDAVFARLGPDAPGITEHEFFDAMKGRRGALKNWLLNQQMLSGLGNIYADEALFIARLHPLTEPGRVRRDAARRLLRAIKKVLEHSVGLQGTSFRDYVDIEGRSGNFAAKLRVYGRLGEPCRRCRRPVRRLVIAGRSSHFCPQCQPRPRHAASPTRKPVIASRPSALARRHRQATSRRRGP
ncbi:MAG TPA: bifunctional DNA-formamidopyrimidine glycosylase/DNA-(apurinic or apyrimidinic site) lyase [Terriglobia bacterium]|nr:bifunctional DNA-formamidopyrimidine glycosylase/DNA-(apurinic or apyrimidinic site) lyase [Terriglobia bacterium]